MGNGGGGDLDGVPAGVEDGGVVGDEDVDAVDVGGGATRSGRRRGRRGGGAAASGEERAASRRRGVGAETRTTGRRRGGGAAASGEERGRGSRARAREREGIDTK